ncbi:squalene/phytoene synthase family protein [Frigidibacter albus]|uniref:Squalene/phytoene synthase family protein n=1 Tax=Frigidibacter albus TaxID=1465486 RepID=A0A6L8VFQ3_9RHOB|nr:squalene/phytoene synthase family protein [Frigidibacter albus]MZQ88060.1 squalene/phytoene synthase family protein [Frigidibacter albus]NBE30266.1 squalene/phytoene synthase family protein [Frigidibacter albus]GGH47723.1 phytoene synthase [Frigidibacter albus]
MSLHACAALVETGDPDRFLAAMAAPPAARARLWPLYALNLELARAPWASAEPLVAEMRLQWWVDTLDRIAAGERPRTHEVAGPLADLIAETGQPVAPLQAIAEARRLDCWGEPFAGTDDLLAYLGDTAGNLMLAAGQALGAPEAAHTALQDAGLATGIANWLVAVPDLIARGRAPLPDPGPEAIAALARTGLASLTRARNARSALPAAAIPALYPAWQTGALLSRAAADPGQITQTPLRLSEFSRRGRLLLTAATGRI